MFGADGDDLRQVRPLPARFEIDWKHYFEIAGQTGTRNTSRLIDGTLALPLFSLPPTTVSDAKVSLARRKPTFGQSRSGLRSRTQAAGRRPGAGPGKGPPVRQRRYADRGVQVLAQRRCRAEPDPSRNLVHPQFGGFEQPSSVVDTC
jgi:hypothetical protein